MGQERCSVAGVVSVLARRHFLSAAIRKINLDV